MKHPSLSFCRDKFYFDALMWGAMPTEPVKSKALSSWISAPLVLGVAGLLFLLELRRPLRKSVEPKIEHDTRNLAVAAIGAAALQIAERPMVSRLAARVEERRWGLLKILNLPVWLEVPLAVVLMDYTLYIWHVLTHRVPFLWRFHLVHHIDLDLDASTALRFHFGELLLSVPWRAAQVLVLGVSPLSLSTWQTFLLISIMFHHSNVRLPINIERTFNRLVVTPRMHGIHHSIVREETNSNWSSGLTIWDRLHDTLRLDVPQDEITIGVPAYRSLEEVELPALLKLPFTEERPAWTLPERGEMTMLG
jgi:sterol desaturase/sphingolipid hydroxylase (fatty acid hydroxylase superfamily)